MMLMVMAMMVMVTLMMMVVRMSISVQDVETCWGRKSNYLTKWEGMEVKIGWRRFFSEPIICFYPKKILLSSKISLNNFGKHILLHFRIGYTYFLRCQPSKHINIWKGVWSRFVFPVSIAIDCECRQFKEDFIKSFAVFELCDWQQLGFLCQFLNLVICSGCRNLNKDWFTNFHLQSMREFQYISTPLMCKIKLGMKRENSRLTDSCWVLSN